LVGAAADGARVGGVDVGGTVEQIGVELQLKLTDERQRARAARVQQRQQTQSSPWLMTGARDVTRRRHVGCVIASTRRRRCRPVADSLTRLYSPNNGSM